MQVLSSAADSIDQSVIEAFEEQPGQAVRIRIQPSVLRRPDNRRTYLAWRDLHWMVEIETLEEAQALREALTLFFQLLEKRGVGALRALLQTALTPPSAT